MMDPFTEIYFDAGNKYFMFGMDEASLCAYLNEHYETQSLLGVLMYCKDAMFGEDTHQVILHAISVVLAYRNGDFDNIR